MSDDKNNLGSGRAFIAAAVLAVGGIVTVGGALLFLGGGKPVPAPRSVSFDRGSDTSSIVPSGQTVTLQPDQIASAGIRTEEAGEGVVSGSGAVIGTGVIQPDAYRDVRLMALVGGIVTAINLEPGSRVEKGAVIGVAESDGFIKAQSEFVTARVAADNARKVYERSLRLLQLNQPGRTEYDGARRAFVTAEAAAAETRSRYERALKLVEIGSISREQFEAERAKCTAVEADLAETKARLERAKELLEVSPEAKSQVESAEADLTRAQGEVGALRERLRILGMTDGEIDRLSSPERIDRIMKLRAPISGTLLSRSVAPGQIFEEGSELLRVADLSDLWFIAQVGEESVGRLPVGALVEVSIAGSVITRTGRVVYRDPAVNDKTRTVQIRVVVGNSDRKLLLGSYATIALSGMNEKKEYPIVKASSVQNLEGANYVFVANSDGVTFELRQVRLGDESQGLVPVLEGLSAREKVVVEGAFLLRAEYLKRKGN